VQGYNAVDTNGDGGWDLKEMDNIEKRRAAH
jgi:hypothetical protein